ncbi:GNAT family N-acetyltransferase [Arthrobacter sp. MMS18-M83]|uniref:GNAT family N-acetyltransferase n=1 Tax=Arthrobacter sp. MMS18-M83 TaxID=2996261 RepID=UPI00227BFD97|nr:GNAT family N-acetyltransferase [Arthrobacter sp. MMS18-M83]WAH96272.1 GNAT family N-acetyltransferase [Arthrobacter sp. MMS18-M83]
MAASLISLAALVGPQDLKPAAHALRNIKATDLPPLAELYVHSYGDGTSPRDREKAAHRISAVLKGSHGTLIPQASLLTADAEGRIIAAILTTARDFGTAGPGTAFIAELFTDPDHRRQGLAEELLNHALQALHDTGHRTVAVTVDSTNAAAVALYLSRDFRRPTQPAENN